MNRTKGLTFAIQSSKIAIQPFERRTMDEQDIVSFLKRHGWTYTRRERGKKGRLYVYAQRREDAGITERYIAPLTKVRMLTHEQIIQKLEKSSPKTETAANFQSLHELKLTA